MPGDADADHRGGGRPGRTHACRQLTIPGDNEATILLGRALKQDGPRPGDPKTDNRERLKTNYEEAAYRQLQAELAK